MTLSKSEVSRFYMMLVFVIISRQGLIDSKHCCDRSAQTITISNIYTFFNNTFFFQTTNKRRNVHANEREVTSTCKLTNTSHTLAITALIYLCLIYMPPLEHVAKNAPRDKARLDVFVINTDREIALAA